MLEQTEDPHGPFLCSTVCGMRQLLRFNDELCTVFTLRSYRKERNVAVMHVLVGGVT